MFRITDGRARVIDGKERKPGEAFESPQSLERYRWIEVVARAEVEAEARFGREALLASLPTDAIRAEAHRRMLTIHDDESTVVSTASLEGFSEGLRVLAAAVRDEEIAFPLAQDVLRPMGITGRSRKDLVGDLKMRFGFELDPPAAPPVDAEAEPEPTPADEEASS